MDTCNLSLFQYLRIANHELKVVIAVDAGAQVLVVVLELFDGHNVVSLMGLPDLHEVGQHLISSLPATLEVGVEAHIVGDLDVLDCDLATAILVKHLVGLMDHVQSALVKLTADGSQELVERKLSILVRIEVLDNLSDLDLRKV